MHNLFIVANNTSGCGRRTEQLSILKRAVASAVCCVGEKGQTDLKTNIFQFIGVMSGKA